MWEYGMASVHHLYMLYPRNSCDVTRIRSLFIIIILHPAGGLYNDISSPTPSHICFSTSSMHTRKSCLCRPLWYSICVSTLPDDTDLLSICVADKPKRRKQAQNVFVDDCRFPDKTEHYKALLRNVEGGLILQKLKHPAPPLDKVDPLFLCTYNKTKHSKQMQRGLGLSPLKPQVRDRVYGLVKKYWQCLTKMEALSL